MLVALDVDAVAVAVAPGSHRHQHGPRRAGLDRRLERADHPSVRVGDGQHAVRAAVPLQRPSRPYPREHRSTGLRHRIHQPHPVRAREHHALGVELNALVQRRHPALPERPPDRAGGEVRAPEDQGQGAGQFQVGLRQQHLPGRHIHRVPAILHRPRRTRDQRLVQWTRPHLRGPQILRHPHERIRQLPPRTGRQHTTAETKRPAEDHPCRRPARSRSGCRNPATLLRSSGAVQRRRPASSTPHHRTPPPSASCRESSPPSPTAPPPVRTPAR